MGKIDLEKLLEICKRKIDKKEDVFAFLEEKSFYDDLGEVEINELENAIHEYIFLKEEQESKNQKYWMLLCNPLKWYEDTYCFQVNDLLFNLDKEFWKINGKTVYPNIKVGDKGIIKVGEDARTIENRRDENNEIVDKLDAGIYATFEVIKNEERKSHKKREEGIWGEESFVYIKVIDNFFRDNKIIHKNKAIELLGRTTFETKSSKKIEKNLYTRVENEVNSLP